MTKRKFKHIFGNPVRLGYMSLMRANKLETRLALSYEGMTKIRKAKKTVQYMKANQS